MAECHIFLALDKRLAFIDLRQIWEGVEILVESAQLARFPLDMTGRACIY
jgi:hypothetical protein